MMQGMLGQPGRRLAEELPGCRAAIGARRSRLPDGPGAAHAAGRFFGGSSEPFTSKAKRERARRGSACRICCIRRSSPTFSDHSLQYGDTSTIPTANFFYGLQPGDEIAVEIERGKTLIIRYLTTGEAREDGTRTVFFELNGQPRDVRVARSIGHSRP